MINAALGNQHKGTVLFPNFKNLSAQGIVIFTIGFTMPLSILLSGFTLYPTEIVIALYVVFHYRLIIKSNFESHISKVLILFLIITIGITLTSLFYQISSIVYLGELSNVLLLFTNILFCSILILKNQFSHFLLSFIFGLIFFKIFIEGAAFIYFWKYGAVLIVFYLVVFFSFRNLTKLQNFYLNACTALALILSVIYDSRIMIVLFSLRLLLDFLQKRLQGRGSIVGVFTILIFALPLLYVTYVYLVTNGFMGQAAYIRYNDALENPLGPIFGSRTNNLITIQYGLESPFWGHGAYSPIEVGSNFNSSLFRFSEQVSLIQNVNFTPHSFLLRFWYSGGLIALLASFLLLFSYLRILFYSMKQSWASGIPILILLLASFLLNPISGISRIFLACLLALVLHSRLNHLSALK